MPKDGIDAKTHPKIKKLVARQGDNRSFYFHDDTFLPSKDGNGSLMIFYGSTDTIAIT